jgi:hypothetical protein
MVTSGILSKGANLGRALYQRRLRSGSTRIQHWLGAPLPDTILECRKVPAVPLANEPELRPRPARMRLSLGARPALSRGAGGAAAWRVPARLPPGLHVAFTEPVGPVPGRAPESTPPPSQLARAAPRALLPHVCISRRVRPDCACSPRPSSCADRHARCPACPTARSESCRVLCSMVAFLSSRRPFQLHVTRSGREAPQPFTENRRVTRHAFTLPSRVNASVQRVLRSPPTAQSRPSLGGVRRRRVIVRAECGRRPRRGGTPDPR